MINIEYTEYIKPELLVLVPVLLAIGAFFKSAAFIPNKYIPLALSGVGVFLSALWIFATSAADNVALAVFTSVVQGILCAAAAVYGHQMVKQLGTGAAAETGEDGE